MGVVCVACVCMLYVLCMCVAFYVCEVWVWCVCVLCPHLSAQVPALTSLIEQMIWLYQLIIKPSLLLSPEA